MDSQLSLLGIAGFLAGPVALIVVLRQRSRLDLLERELQELRRHQTGRPEPLGELAARTIARRALEPEAVVPAPQPVAAPLAVAPVASLAPALADVPSEPAPSDHALRDVPADESALGQRGLAWGGGGLLVIGLGLLVKVAWDRGWLGELLPPVARLALVGAAGLALLTLGWLRARREATPVNQVLAGTGLAGMYLATVAARAPEFCLVPEPLLSAGGAFALLGLISALGLATAVTIAAPAVALLALFGGQLALGVAPDSGSRHGLLIHQLLIELGVLGAAAWCGWRWVARLTVASVVAGSLLWWLHRGPGPAPNYASLGWLAALAAPMVVLPGWRAWRARQVLPPWTLGLACGALVWFSTQAVVLLRETAPWSLALIAVLLGALGLLVWHWCRRRVPADGPTQASGLVVAAAALAVAILAVVPAEAQAAAWLAEGLALLTIPRWIGVTMPLSLRLSGVAVLALGSLKTLNVVAIAHGDGGVTDPDVLALVIAAVVYAVLAWRGVLVATRDALDRALMTGALFLWPLLLGTAGVVLARNLPAFPELSAWTLVAAVWMVATLGAVALGRPGADPVGRLAILAPLGATLICVLGAMSARTATGLPLFNIPAILAVVALSAVALSGRVTSGTQLAERWLWGLGAGLLISVEAYTWCTATISDQDLAQSAGLAAVTVLWAVSGLGFLALGLGRGQPVLRQIGLAAFAAAAGKLLVIDLAGRDAGIRVAAFLGLGILFLAGAHLYQRFAKRGPR